MYRVGGPGSSALCEDFRLIAKVGTVQRETPETRPTSGLVSPDPVLSPSSAGMSEEGIV